MDPRTALAEARAALAEAQLEIPDEWMAAFTAVMKSAARAGRLPKEAPRWAADKAPRSRRSGDRVARGTDPPPASAHTPGEPVKFGSGRSLPGTNRFVQDPGPSPRAQRVPEPRPDDFADEPTDADGRPPISGRDGDEEDFPSLPAPSDAATDVTGHVDDRVLSRTFIDGPPEDGKIDVPDANMPIGMRILKRGQAQQPKPGSISRLFRRRADGRADQRRLDKAMRKMDRDAQRATKRSPRGQGVLGRLIKGKDVTR